MKESIKVVTIDGPSASGKTTVSKLISQSLGWNFLSTGVFYRSLAYVSKGINLDDSDVEQKLVNLIDGSWQVIMQAEKTAFILNGRDVTNKLSTEEIGTRASQISTLPAVREALLNPQRELASSALGGLIAEGRDCATVVFPNADLKFYLTAHDSARLSRRFYENQNLAKFQLERDERDIKRKHSPLSIAAGSIVIDTTKVELNDVVQCVLGHIKKFY